MTIAMKMQGFFVGQTRIRTAMQVMGLEAIYPKPNLSIANREHKKFPYLLRNLVVDHPDHAWPADITYIPMPTGFGYLFAIIDWFSRYFIECDCYLTKVVNSLGDTRDYNLIWIHWRKEIPLAD